jgi:hypothetical protein
MRIASALVSSLHDGRLIELLRLHHAAFAFTSEHAGRAAFRDDLPNPTLTTLPPGGMKMPFSANFRATSGVAVTFMLPPAFDIDLRFRI